MRIAKMPHVHWDDDRKRFIVRRRVPADVQAIIGGKPKVVTHKFGQGIDRATANDLSVDIVRGWEAEWRAMRARTPCNLVAATPCGRMVEVAKTVCTVIRPGQHFELTGGTARLITGRHGETILVEHLPVEREAKPPEPAPPASASRYPACATETVLTCLIADRETLPKNKGVRAKRRAMKALYAFLGKPDDVTLITAGDMQLFKEHLVETQGNTMPGNTWKTSARCSGWPPTITRSARPIIRHTRSPYRASGRVCRVRRSPRPRPLSCSPPRVSTPTRLPMGHPAWHPRADHQRARRRQRR